VNARDRSRYRAALAERASAPGASGLRPAGFWRRFLAYAIDWLLLAPIMIVLLPAPLRAAWTESKNLVTLVQDWMLAKMLADASGLPSLTSLLSALLLDPALLGAAQLSLVRISLALCLAALIGAGAAAIYFIGFEASRWQATPGKRLLGVSVVDLRGARLDWRRAAARFLAGSLSWLSFNLGHALAGWNADGRALHDLLAGTRVVARTPMPAWARWLLYALLGASLAVIIALLLRLFWQLMQLAEAGLL
jgi:uncharacterized RDD family membrane protein YckC